MEHVGQRMILSFHVFAPMEVKVYIIVLCTSYLCASSHVLDVCIMYKEEIATFNREN